MKKTLLEPSVSEDKQMLSMVNRRYFLRSAGVAAATGAFILGACTDHDIEGDQTVDLGSGDVGILNYAYALEQLEAAFYTQVLLTPYDNMSFDELKVLEDIRDHEIIHRQFFKTALGSSAIKGLTPNFSSINFKDRASVLGAARLFEDTGVQAYNGAGKLIASPDYLVLAGKIVSVEARHAAVIRNLLAPFTTVSLGDAGAGVPGVLVELPGAKLTAFDAAVPPSVILPMVQPFVMDKISGSNLPS
jgi:hypothetical protein